MAAAGIHHHDAPPPIAWGQGCPACDEWAIRTQPVSANVTPGYCAVQIGLGTCGLVEASHADGELGHPFIEARP